MLLFLYNEKVLLIAASYDNLGYLINLVILAHLLPSGEGNEVFVSFVDLSIHIYYL